MSQPDIARKNDIRNRLIDDVMTSTARKNDALRDFNWIRDLTPKNIHQPEGAQRIRNASRRLEAARKGMIKAQTRLNDFLVHGIVPEELKQRHHRSQQKLALAFELQAVQSQD